MRTRRRTASLLVLCLACVLALAGASSAPGLGARGQRYDPPGRDDVHRARPSFLGGAGQCTANFVYTDSAGNVYLGQAAHCSSTGEDTETNGCTTKSLPLGTPIYAGDLVNGGLQKGTKIGTLAYNSWLAMQKAGEKDAERPARTTTSP